MKESSRAANFAFLPVAIPVNVTCASANPVALPSPLPAPPNPAGHLLQTIGFTAGCTAYKSEPQQYCA